MLLGKLFFLAIVALNNPQIKPELVSAYDNIESCQAASIEHTAKDADLALPAYREAGVEYVCFATLRTSVI